MKNANGKGDSYRKVDQKQYDKNYAKAFKKRKYPDTSPDKVSQLSFAIWLEYIISAISAMHTKKVVKKGIAQAKKGKFSKNPPKILPKKKKK
jgi:hypothetical protein